MSDFREPIPDDDRDASMNDEDDFGPVPATLDPGESIEDEVDDRDLEERESAIETGEIEP
jgi:hypothetical protein